MKKLISLLLAAVLVCAVFASALGETMTISFIGDCTVGEQYKHRGYKSSYCYKVREAGMDYPFSLAADLFAEDDLTVANCEGSFTNRKPYYELKAMSLSAPPEFVEVFRLGNVDVCNITNNHDTDFGKAGRVETYDALTGVGIGAFGDDSTYICEVKGVKIGFTGQSFPINNQKLDKYREQIQALKAAGCTFIIASAHWGKEGNYKLNTQQTGGAEQLLAMGADLVYGHGPHVLQPMELKDGHLILYSTANFTFGANAAPKDPDTAVFQVTFDIHEDGTLSLNHLTAIPYRMHNNKDFRPWPYTEKADKERVWGKLWRDKKPNSNLPVSFKTTGEVDFTQLLDIPLP